MLRAVIAPRPLGTVRQATPQAEQQALLKIGSTCYRFARYYTGSEPYVRKGPPAIGLRLPAPGPGYDLSLTERIDEAGHRFVVHIGTEAGERVLARISHQAAADAEIDEARTAVAAAAGRMGRQMPELDIRDLLAGSRESPLWEEVAQRCLTCGNCTMVCPTCFCTSTEDVTDLTGEHSERWEHWASCFELGFSYLHGGGVRTSGASRYRQWISHKLSTWHDQFGSSGCVGCGRCIAWCPVGIDITEETTKLAVLAAEE